MDLKGSPGGPARNRRLSLVVGDLKFALIFKSRFGAQRAAAIMDWEASPGRPANHIGPFLAIVGQKFAFGPERAMGM